MGRPKKSQGNLRNRLQRLLQFGWGSNNSQNRQEKNGLTCSASFDEPDDGFRTTTYGDDRSSPSTFLPSSNTNRAGRETAVKRRSTSPGAHSTDIWSNASSSRSSAPSFNNAKMPNSATATTVQKEFKNRSNKITGTPTSSSHTSSDKTTLSSEGWWVHSSSNNVTTPSKQMKPTTKLNEGMISYSAATSKVSKPSSIADNKNVRPNSVATSSSNTDGFTRENQPMGTTGTTIPVGFSSPDVVTATGDGWDVFPSSSSNAFEGFNNWGTFTNWDTGKSANQDKAVIRNLFPSNDGVENIPDPDFLFLEEDEEESFHSAKDANMAPLFPNPFKNSKNLPSASVASNRHEISNSSEKSPAIASSHQMSPPMSSLTPENFKVDYGPSRVGITPSPKWDSKSRGQMDSSTFPLASNGMLILNEHRSECGVSSIGVHSAGSAFRTEKTLNAAAAASARALLDDLATGKQKSAGIADLAKAKRRNSLKENRTNLGNSTTKEKMDSAQCKSNNSCALSSSSSSYGDTADGSVSSSDSNDNTFLFEAVENILGPRTMSADLESLGGLSNRSGGSRKPTMRHRRIVSKRSEEMDGKSFSSAVSLRGSESRPPGLKRSNSYQSSKSVQLHRSSKQDLRYRSPRRDNGDSVSVSSRVSHGSNTFQNSKDVTARLLQLEGKLMTPPRGSDNSSLAAGRNRERSGFSEITRARGEAKERQIVVIAPPGRLGVILSNATSTGGTVVMEVREFSPLFERIGVGDKIIAVDDENVAGMTVTELTNLMSKKSNVHRTLTILTGMENIESDKESLVSRENTRERRSSKRQ